MMAMAAMVDTVVDMVAIMVDMVVMADMVVVMADMVAMEVTTEVAMDSITDVRIDTGEIHSFTCIYQHNFIILPYLLSHITLRYWSSVHGH